MKNAKLEKQLELLRCHLDTQFTYTIQIILNEIIIEIAEKDWLEVAYLLRDNMSFDFKMCIDACGVDYSLHPNKSAYPSRFAMVYQLLSLSRNWRLRIRVFCAEEKGLGFPSITSMVTVWRSINWFEREAFDLYGIVFIGHPDLRRLLTDYGFVGHPFRKDFPLSGHVEMRYDSEQGRVIYQPITIAPREIIPRIRREENDSE